MLFYQYTQLPSVSYEFLKMEITSAERRNVSLKIISLLRNGIDLDTDLGFQEICIRNWRADLYQDLASIFSIILSCLFFICNARVNVRMIQVNNCKQYITAPELMTFRCLCFIKKKRLRLYCKEVIISFVIIIIISFIPNKYIYFNFLSLYNTHASILSRKKCYLIL